jgi:hypothetical protein
MRTKGSKNHVSCGNINCRSNNRAKVKSEFCPACKGMIALKYDTNHGISIKKAKIIVMVLDPCAPNDMHNELTDMYAIAESIEIRRFLRRVPLIYINAYFGYKSARSKGLMFQDDKSLVFYESKYLKCSVFIMEKDGIHFIFAQPLAFGAANFFHNPDQTSTEIKIESVQNDSYSPFDDSLEEHQSFSN